jgi:hypothetical protein
MADDELPAGEGTTSGTIVPEASSPSPHESRRQRQRRLKRPPGRPRNPALERRFQPSDQDREVVKLLSGFGLPLERIAKAVRNPLTRRAIGVNTLQARFEHELEQGRAAIDQLLAGTLARKLQQGNIVAAIWCSKNLWNWSDRLERTNTGTTTTDVNVRIAPEELSRKLKEFGLPSYVFGCDKPKPEEPRLIEGNGLAQDNGDDGNIGKLPISPTEPED